MRKCARRRSSSATSSRNAGGAAGGRDPGKAVTRRRYTRPMPARAIDPATFPAPLQAIAEKVRDGVRLDEADALTCFTTPHLLHLGKLADSVRRRLHGDVAYFNVNRHINPTNVC